MAGADISGLTPETGRAVRDTLSGAVAAGEGLPDQLGVQLVDAARDAFVYGFEVTAAVSAIVAIALALVAGVVLRNVRRDREPGESTPEQHERGQVAGDQKLATIAEGALS
jgi:MFS transporter, DHA2 family, multidrug resistance protein